MSICSGSLSDVTIMIGMAAKRSSARSVETSSSPLMPGMCQSTNAMSGSSFESK